MDLPYLMISIDLNSHSLTKIPPLVPPPRSTTLRTELHLEGEAGDNAFTPRLMHKLIV